MQSKHIIGIYNLNGLIILFFLLGGLTGFTSYGQNIYTTAGNGSAGFSGDGGAATAAAIYNPVGVATDVFGNIFISDKNNQRIRKINGSTGVISTVAGNGTTGFSGDGGPATSAALNLPWGIATDVSGNIYIADAFNNRIRKVTMATGIISTVAGNGIAGFSGDGGEATSAEISNPVGVATDASGNIFISDKNNQRIRKINGSNGIISTIAGNGSTGFSGDGGPATSASFNLPWGIATDTFGNIYISDSFNNRIRKVTLSTGIISTIAGNGTAGFSGDGGNATAAEISNPVGVVTDAVGNIYIVDKNNQRIRKMNASNAIISTIAGNGSAGFSGDGGAATAAELNLPWDVETDATSNIFIADAFNNRIRKVSNTAGSIDLTTETKISIFPNPSQGIITIEDIRISKIEVVNMFGENVYKATLNSQIPTSVNLSKQSPGVYFIRITLDNNDFYLRKIIIID